MTEDNARQITISEPEETQETTTTSPPVWDQFAEPLAVGDHVQVESDGALHHAEVVDIIHADGTTQLDHLLELGTGLIPLAHHVLKVPQDHQPNVSIPVLHTREDADAYYNPKPTKRPRESGPAHSHTSTRRTTTRTSSSRRK